jgi:hypothetical protein
LGRLAAHFDDDPIVILDSYDGSGANLINERVRLKRLVVVLSQDEFAIKGGHGFFVAVLGEGSQPT